MTKQEFMKAVASSMAKMVDANPINVLIIDELTTFGAILTAELYDEKEEQNDTNKYYEWNARRRGKRG